MITEQLGDLRVVLLKQDSFYHTLTSKEISEVQEYNFDHPDAFDTEKLLAAMEMLKHGKAIDIPQYDFKSYKIGVAQRGVLSDHIYQHVGVAGGAASGKTTICNMITEQLGDLRVVL
nr:uridine kinase-like protein 4 [Tanacetum cinerariifolium]